MENILLQCGLDCKLSESKDDLFKRSLIKIIVTNTFYNYQRRQTELVCRDNITNSGNSRQDGADVGSLSYG
jgi:hypothetical protein